MKLINNNCSFLCTKYNKNNNYLIIYGYNEVYEFTLFLTSPIPYLNHLKIVYDSKAKGARLEECPMLVWINLMSILKKRKSRSLNIRRSCKIRNISLDEATIVCNNNLIIRIRYPYLGNAYCNIYCYFRWQLVLLADFGDKKSFHLTMIKATQKC